MDSATPQIDFIYYWRYEIRRRGPIRSFQKPDRWNFPESTNLKL